MGINYESWEDFVDENEELTDDEVMERAEMATRACMERANRTGYLTDSFGW